MQQELSNYMNTVRHIKKQSISEFSKELGISKSALQGILNGTSNPRMDTLQYIAEQLNVKMADLFSCPYTQSQFAFADLLLLTIDAFSQLSPGKKEKAAELFHELILLMEETTHEK